MKILNTFVQYHGCNIGYKDGTRRLVKRGNCSNPTFYPFRKNAEHTTNYVAKSTRAQLTLKPIALSDSGYNNETLPDTNYYKMSELTGDDLIINIKPDPDNIKQKEDMQNSDNEQKPDIEQEQNLIQNPDKK